jgi:hypothetical protein
MVCQCCTGGTITRSFQVLLPWFPAEFRAERRNYALMCSVEKSFQVMISCIIPVSRGYTENRTVSEITEKQVSELHAIHRHQ